MISRIFWYFSPKKKKIWFHEFFAISSPKKKITWFHEFFCNFFPKEKKDYLWYEACFTNFFAASPQCGNYGDLLSRIFGKNFVKVTDLLKESLNSWFDEIFFSESKFFIFPQHTVEKWKIYSHLNKIFVCQNNSIVIHLVNAFVSRNFCQKCMRVNFRNFHTVNW